MPELIGHGSKLKVDGTEVAGVMSIDDGSNKIDTPETTNMSTAGTSRTYIGGLENQGDITVKFNVIPGDSSQAAFYAAKDGAIHAFTAILPGAVASEDFNGIITSITKSNPDDKLITRTAKIQITGPRTLA